MSEWDRLRRIAQTTRESYPSGTRIVLIHMGDDDPNPIPDGTRGTVVCVDDIGTVFCDFDSGRSLGLAYGADSYRKLTPQELAEEEQNDMDEDTGPVMRM